MHNAPHYRITHAHRFCDGDFALELETPDGELALATVSIDETTYLDPRLTVLSCTDAAAREWLEAAEHERAVIDVCLQRPTAEERAKAARDVDAAMRAAMGGRALRLLRGEVVS